MSKPLIFESVTIDGNTYELRDEDGTEIGNEVEKVLVDNGLEIPASYLSSLTIPIFDLDVSSDLLLSTDIDPATDKVTISLNGASGSSTVTLEDVYPVGCLKFDKPLPYYEVTAQAKGASAPISVS